MNFETALRLLKAGHTVKLKNWIKSEYLALKNKEIRLFWNGKVQEWKTFTHDILSNQWEVIEPMIFYDQGFKDGHESGWDEALKKYLAALEHYDVPSRESLCSFIKTLREKDAE